MTKEDAADKVAAFLIDAIVLDGIETGDLQDVFEDVVGGDGWPDVLDRIKARQPVAFAALGEFQPELREAALALGGLRADGA